MSDSAGRRRPLAFALWIVVIFIIVVPWYRVQDHPHWQRISWIPFEPPVRVRDVVLNVLLYMPYGYLFMRRLARPAAGRAVLSALLLSVLTEATQIYSHGRFTSVTDVVTNTAGAWAGAHWALRRAARRRAAPAA